MLKKYLLGILLSLTIFILNGCSNSRPTTNMNYYQGEYQKGRISYFSKYGYNSPESRVKNNTPYLDDTSHLRNGKFIGRREDDFLKFYKDLNIKGYGSISDYWRWNYTIDSSAYSKSINKTLKSSGTSYIYTLENRRWIKKSIPNNPVGKLKDIVVLERGNSGVVTYLLIRGTNGEYLIKGEYTIRKVLGLSKYNTGVDTDIKFAKYGENYRIKKVNANLLPSGFFAIEKRGNNFTFYGGGFGHGAGMSQYGACDLTKNYGKDYKDVLDFYYKDIKIKNMYSLPNAGKFIRVGLTTNNMLSTNHQNVGINILSKSELKNSWFNIKLNKNDKIKILPRSGKLEIYVNGIKRATTQEKVTLRSSNNKFMITTIRRGHTSTPTYRGSLDIRVSPQNPGSINLINEVFIEDYLLQVVPSEMPKSFGIEALKVQAVAARTYALSDYLKKKYKNQGYHVLDSTLSQVYNNTNENSETREAVKKTYGQVMLYNNQPIDAIYYSTSSGMGASANTVW